MSQTDPIASRDQEFLQLYQGVVNPLLQLNPAARQQVMEILRRSPYSAEAQWENLITVQMPADAWYRLEAVLAYWCINEVASLINNWGDPNFSTGWARQSHELLLAIRDRTPTSGGWESLQIGSRLWHDVVIGGFCHAGGMAMDELPSPDGLFTSQEQLDQFLRVMQKVERDAARAGLMAFQQLLKPPIEDS